MGLIYHSFPEKRSFFAAYMYIWSHVKMINKYCCTELMKKDLGMMTQICCIAGIFRGVKFL